MTEACQDGRTKEHAATPTLASAVPIPVDGACLGLAHPVAAAGVHDELRQPHEAPLEQQLAHQLRLAVAARGVVCPGTLHRREEQLLVAHATLATPPASVRVRSAVMHQSPAPVGDACSSGLVDPSRPGAQRYGKALSMGTRDGSV